MTSSATQSAAEHRTLATVMFAGIVAGFFDGTYAVAYFGLTRGAPAHRIFQHVASGLLGRASFDLGWKSVALGVACHFTVAIGAAATYAIASRAIPALLRKPFLFGPLFGIVIYVFMNFVVVPLSRVTPSRGPAALDILVTGILVHMFLIGLPIGLIVSRPQVVLWNRSPQMS
jgi:uncharacterized membrane protein YagU involved in acid resistance